MNASIRSCLTSGIAVAGVSALVLASGAPQDIVTGTKQPAIALAAQAVPVPVPVPTTSTPTALTPTTITPQPLALVGEQVAFHVDLFVDFIVTGAQLVERQVAVPGTLLRDIANGAPLPVAVGRALQTLVEVELDAGRELVGFAAKYIDFQIRFIAKVLQNAVAIATAVSVAVGELVAAAVASFTPTPITAPEKAEPEFSAAPVVSGDLKTAAASHPEPAESSDSAESSHNAESSDDATGERVAETEDTEDAEDTEGADGPAVEGSSVTKPDSDSGSTVRAQGEINSGTTDTTDGDADVATTSVETPEAGESDEGEQPQADDATPNADDDSESGAQSDSASQKN